MPIRLDDQGKRIRELLILVAKGEFETHKLGLISYKELWTSRLNGSRLFRGTWGRGRKDEIVRRITNISAYDLSHNRPPLNELVVVKGSQEPGEEWANIKTYLESEFEVIAPYSSHQEAQEACWRYWGRKNHKKMSEEEAEEGYKQDRTVTFRYRNAGIIVKRKKVDNYTCQACGFRLHVNGKFIIDCHHKNPFNLVESITITNIEHLVCLCPTCHRISHTKKYPLNVEEIKAIRGILP